MHLTDTPPTVLPRWVVPTAVMGAIGVCLYVSGWAIAGLLRPGYSPVSQAISELFEIGAPAGSRAVMIAGLVSTGILLVVFAPAAHRGLPGTGLAGPIAIAIAGVGTLAVTAFPCTSGCPGFGTTFTDTMHVITAGTSYVALLGAPALFGLRLRGHDDRLARISLALGFGALALFAFRNLAGFGDDFGGFQQRIFNTLGDLWYVLAAIAIVHRARIHRDVT